MTQYFKGVVSLATYTSPTPPREGVSGKISVAGDYPKRIVHEVEHWCAAQDELPGGEREGGECWPASGTETWAYDGETYRVKKVPRAERLQAARAAAKAGDHKDAAGRFGELITRGDGDAGVWGEMGWAFFKAGRLDLARRATDVALGKAESDGRKGALLYNLGRIAEAEGQPGQAATRYRASLKLRANDTVRERLDAVDPDGTLRGQ